MGGEDGGGEGEGCILGLTLWSLWKHRQEMQPRNSRENTALLQDVCFTPLHVFFLVCCWVARVGVCGFGFFQAVFIFFEICFVLFLLNNFILFLKFLPLWLSIQLPSPLPYPS